MATVNVVSVNFVVVGGGDGGGGVVVSFGGVFGVLL